MRADEVYSITPNDSGWRMLPNGNWVTLGNRVKLGYEVKLGDGVTLGNRVTLGDEVKLGNWVTLGDGVAYSITPPQVQCHPYIVYPFSLGHVGVGCIVHPREYWLRSEDPNELRAHPECLPWSNYRCAIEMIADWQIENGG